VATTPTYGWPYQTLSDRPDGPNLGEDLALAIEATVVALAARVSTLETTVNTTRIPQQALVATSQTTTSTSYTDLATVGPAVTLTTGATALVTVGGQIQCSASTITAFMSWAVSGATTSAAVDAGRAAAIANVNLICASRVFLMTGLTPGSNTFTAKYKVNGVATGTFQDRYIMVQAY
jgi:hypothetical protein